MTSRLASVIGPDMQGQPNPAHAWRRPAFACDDRAAGGTAEEPVRVLVVEDDFLVAIQVQSTLTDAGYEVVGIAASAAEAVEMARTGKPTLVIMDIRLGSGPDGVDAAIELCRTLGLRCIFATAHDDPRIRARATEAKPLGWLTKPYSPQALIALVRQGLREIDDE